MNLSAHRQRPGGQALVELVIILPILLLFIAAVLPIVTEGVALPWLDERLNLRHLSQDSEKVHQLLQVTHAQELLPPYFDEAELVESTEIVHRGVSIPLLSRTFPGDLTRKFIKATIPKHEWWHGKLLGEPQEQNLRISRDLTMVTAQILSESKVPNEVKRLTLIGVVSGGIDILRKAGFNLFYLNLDALPENEEKRGGR